jgi:NitT/TauT family transport system substrate-binding protein
MSRKANVVRASLVALAVGLGAGSAQAQEDVSVAVGGRAFLGYLPLTLAAELGYYEEEGLNVEIIDFAGGAKSMEALIGGSVDIALGGFEHALRLQPKGVEIRAVALINTSFGQVIALKPDLARTYSTPADLRGLSFGVIGPGSASAIALNILLAKDGLKPTDIGQIGIGGGPSAIAAVKSGELDGVSNSDPVISQILHDGDMVAIIDTRTPEGQTYLYGGPVAATSVMTTPEFIEQNRPAAQAFVTAIVRALKWMSEATPEEIADTVPPDYYGDRRELYIEGVKALQNTYTSDGIYRDEEIDNTMKVLIEHGSLPGAEDVDAKRAVDNSLAEASSS